MVTKKMTAQQFIMDVAKAFQEGDTLKWEDGYISFYGNGMDILSEYNTLMEEALFY